jgi:hypothetical protein
MSEIDPPQAPNCPPHHWLIGDPVHGVEHWKCLRCGVEHEQEKPHALPHRWQSNQSAKEKQPPSPEPDGLNTEGSSG